MASWRAPSSILEAPGLDFGASRPRFWSLQARLWSSWHNCLLCLAFSCFVLLSLAFSCCLLLSLTFSCLLLPALASSCFLLLSRDSSGFIMRFPFHRYSGFASLLGAFFAFFAFFALPSCIQNFASKKLRKKCENRGFWPPKTLPKPSQNPSKIEAPKNMQILRAFGQFFLKNYCSKP